MEYKKILPSLVLALMIGSLLPTATLAHEGAGSSMTTPGALLPNEMLAKEASSNKVYYLQGATKRWIDSEAAFLKQGFHWTDIKTMGDGDLHHYAVGETITNATPTGLMVQADLLPDLTAPASRDIYFAVQDGRTILRFTSTFWNRGKGALELNNVAGGAQSDGTIKAAQRVFRADGSHWDNNVGILYWHGPHEHFHFDDFGRYRLELVRPAAAGAFAPLALAKKTTFCLRDDTPMREPAEGLRQTQTYRGCVADRQGVSVGWSDVYLSTLPEQYFDVTDFPAGLYQLSFDVDPNGHFLESRRDNNVSLTFVQIDPATRTETVVASASPFESSDNFYPDGMLIRPEGDPRVYVIQGNKKRHVSSEKAFLAAGYSWNDIIVMPKSIVDVIPTAAPFGVPPAVEVIATGLDVPWEVAFLPDGDLLVTERSGKLKRLGKSPSTIAVPNVLNTGEGGLMGLALHPQFAENQLLYMYFTTSAGGQKNRVSRFRLAADGLKDEKIIIDGIPSAIYHDGGRIAFGPDGMLYVTTGDANVAANSQDALSLAGKTLRVTAEGAIPNDNPFGSAVWSYGHRNAQGIAWDDQGNMWQTEHGRSGATSGYDELNLIVKGGNYGWPVLQGSATGAGMMAPARQSGADDTWAPAGMAVIGNKLYFAGLRGSALYEATIGPSGTVTGMRTLLEGNYGRLRAVRLGPDGYLYITTSNRDGRGTVRAGDDKVLKIHPDYFLN